MNSAFKIAVLLDDSTAAERVARIAAACQMDVVQPQSFAWLADQVSDPHMSAVVVDLTGPRSGGFEGIRELHKNSARANVVVLTSLDARTVESTRRLAESKGFNLSVFRRDEISDDELKNVLCRGRDRAPSFGPEDLDESIEKGYLYVEYQPKVPLQNSSEVSGYGVEALCRINHPRFGKIPPDQFIPLAEKCGLIMRLTDAVVCQSLRDQATWLQAGSALRLAVNVSPDLLRDSEWCDLFLQRAAEYATQSDTVTLEITESSAGATQASALEVLTRLRLQGFALSIDDFGTGFSSLSTLYRLPFGELKIDKSFVADLQKSAEARALVESTVAMAQRIGVKVVAEGVETEALFRELRLIGCHEAQGYFIGKPMPADQIVTFFSGWAARMPSPTVQAGAPSALPKIAMIQALLRDILQDRTVDSDATMVKTDLTVTESDGTDSDRAFALARKIPSLVLQGKTAEALANCHAAAPRFDLDETRLGLKTKIGQLQSLLEQELLTTADIELSGSCGRVRLMSRLAVNLGRPSAGSEVDIPVRCRWLSRAERNLRLFTKSAQWYVEDRGSTNGNFIAGERLEPRRPFTLPVGETIVESGSQPGTDSMFSIVLRRPVANQNVLVVSFVCDAERMRKDLGDEQWAQLQSDIEHTWIVFDGKLVAGNAPDGGLVLPDCGLPMAASIRYRSGYWITPAPNSAVSIGDAVFTSEVPLACNAEFVVGGSRLSVREFDRVDPRPAPAQAPPLSARA